ncbi:hypothetical protein BHECKSOX2_194 [Bathymodiolus heckerae thiotrophic gill symbiont]|nr:hypothetical protein BHECKSOX2_194 [Bathymodiolus heckerae thiotrophic gill symbiont]
MLHTYVITKNKLFNININTLFQQLHPIFWRGLLAFIMLNFCNGLTNLDTKIAS